MLGQYGSGDVETPEGFTALHIASQLGQLTTVMALLSFTPGINDFTHAGYTALHLTAIGGHTQCGMQLLMAGLRRVLDVRRSKGMAWGGYFSGRSFEEGLAGSMDTSSLSFENHKYHHRVSRTGFQGCFGNHTCVQQRWAKIAAIGRVHRAQHPRQIVVLVQKWPKMTPKNQNLAPRIPFDRHVFGIDPPQPMEKCNTRLQGPLYLF